MHHTLKFVAAIAACSDHGLQFSPYYLGDVVSDQYLQDMLRSYRNGYADAGGPDVEDGDQVLLDRFAAAQVRTNAGAYAAGQQQAALDIANKQDVHVTAGYGGGAVVQGPTNPPQPPQVQTAMPERGDAEVYATFQRSAGVVPSNTTSGPIGSAGYASFPQLSGYSQSGGTNAGGFSIFGLDMTTLLILAAIGVGAYLLLKKGK